MREQIRVAAGEPGSPARAAPMRAATRSRCAINAEDPARGFCPSPGTVTRFQPPLGPGVRVDTHLYEGYAVPPNYDSLLAKLIVWDEDRPAAVSRASRALAELVVEGVPTTARPGGGDHGERRFPDGQLHDLVSRRGGRHDGRADVP